MKNILLGIIAINLTFISANLALRSVGAVHAQVTPQDLNEINSETTGDITLGGGEESDEGEESGEAADLNDINSETTGTISATVGDGEEDPE